MNKVEKSWENLYSSQQQISVWPWPEVISGYYKYKELFNTDPNVLEIGAGAGANTTFFNTLKNVNYYGVDISKTAVEILKKRFPGNASRMMCCDFSEDISSLTIESFDFIFDRAAIVHSHRVDLDKIINNIYTLLKPGGIFLGVDWFSDYSQYINEGEAGSSKNERINLKNSFFEGLGVVNFYSKEEIIKSFKCCGFEVVEITHKLLESKSERHGMYLFTAKKN